MLFLDSGDSSPGISATVKVGELGRNVSKAGAAAATAAVTEEDPVAIAPKAAGAAAATAAVAEEDLAVITLRAGAVAVGAF